MSSSSYFFHIQGRPTADSQKHTHKNGSILCQTSQENDIGIAVTVPPSGEIFLNSGRANQTQAKTCTKNFAQFLLIVLILLNHTFRWCKGKQQNSLLFQCHLPTEHFFTEGGTACHRQMHTQRIWFYFMHDFISFSNTIRKMTQASLLQLFLSAKCFQTQGRQTGHRQKHAQNFLLNSNDFVGSYTFRWRNKENSITVCY